MKTAQKDNIKKLDNKLERLSLSQARDMIYENFRTNVRVLRAYKGLSGCECSESIGLKNGRRLIELEYGRTNPQMEEMLLISKYFKVSIDDLLHNKVFITFIQSPKDL